MFVLSVSIDHYCVSFSILVFNLDFSLLYVMQKESHECLLCFVIFCLSYFGWMAALLWRCAWRHPACSCCCFKPEDIPIFVMLFWLCIVSPSLARVTVAVDNRGASCPLCCIFLHHCRTAKERKTVQTPFFAFLDCAVYIIALLCNRPGACMSHTYPEHCSRWGLFARAHTQVCPCTLALARALPGLISDAVSL